MKLGKRDFLKLTGLTLIGAGVKPAADSLAGNAPPPAEKKYKPKEGALVAERWAMVVNTIACKADEGCRDCIDVCHSVHNVPDFGNPKDEIKWIWKDNYEHSFPGQQHEFVREDIKHIPFLMLCNHCDNPPCVRVCPTNTTWKREDGIVMMDMHRCIGCRFCMAACPYGSRSFNWKDPRPAIKKINPDFPTRTRGVVEKCNFCAERLAEGKIPACVEACKHGGLVFGDIGNPESEVRRLLKSHYAIRRKPEIGTVPEVYYIV